VNVQTIRRQLFLDQIKVFGKETFIGHKKTVSCTCELLAVLCRNDTCIQAAALQKKLKCEKGIHWNI
jgi:hypothetical protein